MNFIPGRRWTYDTYVWNRQPEDSIRSFRAQDFPCASLSVSSTDSTHPQRTLPKALRWMRKKPTKNDTSSLDPYIQSGTCSSCRVRSCPLQTKPPLLKDVCWWRANHATWGSNSYLHMSNMSNLGQFFCHPWMVSTWTHRYPNSIGLNWKSKYPLVN